MDRRVLREQNQSLASKSLLHQGTQTSHLALQELISTIDHQLLCFQLKKIFFKFYSQGFSGCGSQALEHRLNSCGSQAQLFRGTWVSPRPRIEPMSPALAGGFFTTEPPGKPFQFFFFSKQEFFIAIVLILGFPGAASGKEPTCQCRGHKKGRFKP